MTENDLQNLHRKVDWVKETSQKTEVNSVAPEGLAVPASQVTPVVLLLSDKNIIWYGNSNVYFQYKPCTSRGIILDVAKRYHVIPTHSMVPFLIRIEFVFFLISFFYYISYTS